MFVLRVMEIVDTAMLYLMTIRYLNSPVTGQEDFLFPVSNNTLPAFLCYVIFDDYKISKQPCDWTGGFSIPSK
jgi:hypothetical protein